MSIGCNAYRTLATALAGLLAVMVVTPVTVAQDAGVAERPQPPAAGAAADQAALEAPLLDRSHVAQAYAWADWWVRRGSTAEPSADQPPVPDVLARSIPVTGCIGLRLTVRKSGITMGVGDVAFDDPVVPLAVMGSVRDLVPLIRKATDQALRATEQSLADAHLKAVVAAVDPKKVPPRLTLAEAGPELLVDLQVAHERAPIRIGRTEEYHALFNQYAPGYHGLILRNPDKPAPVGGTNMGAWLWPVTALASNVSPRSQLTQLLADQGYKSTDLVLVARPGGGPTLDRFSVIHYVRPSPAGRAVFLERGALELPPVSLTRRGIDELAYRMARHLENRIGPTGLVAGTYHPTSDMYDPPTSPDDERALVLYALMRWTNRHPDAGTEGKPQHALARRVAQIAVDMARMQTSGGESPDPAVASLTLLTLIESKASVDRKAERDALAAKLTAMVDGNGYFLERRGEVTRVPNHPTQSLMAAALAAMYEQTRQAELAELINRNLAALWQVQQQSAQMQVTSLPWLLSAELRMSQLGADRAARDPVARKMKFEYLGDLIDKLCRRQIVEPPPVGPDDVIGGFTLDTPMPDWRSAFVLSFIAEALRHPEQAEQMGRDRLGWLLTCGLTARFQALLTFSEAAAFYSRSRSDSLGGVRLAFWDNRLPAASTAMSLLSLTQLQEALATAEGPAGPELLPLPGQNELGEPVDQTAPPPPASRP